MSPLVAVAGRGAGKTHALAAWLLDGTFAGAGADAPATPRPLAPVDWSRRIITTDKRRAGDVLRIIESIARRETVYDLPAAWEEVRHMLAGCIVPVGEALDRLRGYAPGLEIAVDDAETVLATIIGRPVAAMTITGEPWHLPSPWDAPCDPRGCCEAGEACCVHAPMHGKVPRR